MTTLQEILLIATTHNLSPEGYICSSHKTPNPWEPSEVDLARKWICRQLRRKTAGRQGFSYRLKHVAERAEGSYISNGAFLVACFLEGVTVKRDRADSPNADTNLTKGRAPEWA